MKPESNTTELELDLPLKPPQGGNASSTRKPRKPRTAVPDGLAEHVLVELQAACRELNPRASGPAKITPGMLDALSLLHAAEEPTAEEWTRVIRCRLALSKQGDKFGKLTWEHLCRPASFRRYRDEGESDGPAPPTNGQRFDATPEQLHRERAERAAQIAAEEGQL